MIDGQEEGDFVYLGVDDALEIYAAIFNLTTVQAADHLRSREALEGALGRPAAYAHYQEADLALPDMSLGSSRREARKHDRPLAPCAVPPRPRPTGRADWSR